MAIVHDAVDASGRYRVLVEDRRSAGFPQLYRVRVIDQLTHSEVDDDEIYHRDADAICEGWAAVSVLLASHDSHLQGAYILGASAY